MSGVESTKELARELGLTALRQKVQYVVSLLATGRHHIQDTFHITTALRACSAKTALTPQHSMTQLLLGSIGRRLDSLHFREGPKEGSVWYYVY